VIEETEALHEQDEFVYKLYFHAIRRYVDYSTGIVGLKRGISWQSLAEEMYVSPRSGVQYTGKPHKSRLRRAVEQLEKIGLIKNISKGKRLIFKLNFLTQDQSIQNKADTRPTHHPDTEADTIIHLKSIENTVTYSEIESQVDTEADIPEMAQADTPHIVINNKKKKDNTSYYLKKKRATQLPDDFCVTEHHLELANKNQWPNPYDQIDAFRDYHLARATRFVDWDRAFYTWLRNAKVFKERFPGGNKNGNGTNTRRNATVGALFESLKQSKQTMQH
jgi:hypothetical protein